jgi:hypothetical protein
MVGGRPFMSSLSLMYLFSKLPLSEAYEAFKQTPHSLVTNSILGYSNIHLRHNKYSSL